MKNFWLLLVLGLPLSCQIVQGSAGEQRAAERSKAPPPTLGKASYPLDTVERVPELLSAAGTGGWRASGKAVESWTDPAGRPSLRLASSATYALEANTFTPGRSYRLAFSASAIGAQPGLVAIKFREPQKKTSFRTFSQTISGEVVKGYQIDFTAPAYTALPEVQVDVKSGSSLALHQASLTTRAPLVETEPVTSWANSFVPPGYGLVFNDEFSGTALNRRKWFTRYIYSSETLDRLNDENQRYTDRGNHVVAAGMLKLVANRIKPSQPSGINYESGMIRSDFTTHYGFFEARVKMPVGLGTWAAFWVNSDVSATGRFGHPPEIDFFEFVNNGKDDKPNSIHSAATRVPGTSVPFLYQHANFIEKYQNYRAPFNFDEAFHTIGTEWTPKDITLYVDGLKIYTRVFDWKYDDGVLAGPAHVLLNLAIGGQWAGRYGIDDDAFPRSLSVDWVRVYRKTP